MFNTSFMVFLLYALKVTICSGVLFGYYFLFLRNKRFHHYNRFYLLLSLCLSLLLPLIRIPVSGDEGNRMNQIVYQTAQIVTIQQTVGTTAEQAPSTSFLTAGNLLFLLYAAGAGLLLFLLFRSLLYIRRLARRYPYERVEKLRFYQTREPGTPFSFFRAVFWNDELAFNSTQGQQIFRHELFHVQERHSADVMLAELITIAGWFNPFFHLMKKELKAIHEFLADQYAASGNNRYDYATLLVQQIIAQRPSDIGNHFFQNHIKRRIAMITQMNTTRYGYWSRLMVLPLSAILFFTVTLHAGTSQHKKSPAPPKAQEARLLTDTIPVIVDSVYYTGTDGQPHVATEAQVYKLPVQRISNIMPPTDTAIVPQDMVYLKLLREKDDLIAKMKDQMAIQEKQLQQHKQSYLQAKEALQAKTAAELKALEDALQQESLKRDQEMLMLKQETMKKMAQIEKQKILSTDSTLYNLTRFFNRQFRYPQVAIDGDATGSVLFSFELSTTGALSNFQLQKSIAPGATVREIVIVGYAADNKTEKKTLADPGSIFEKEAQRVVEKGATLTLPKPVAAGTYFFRSTFKLEK